MLLNYAPSRCFLLLPPTGEGWEGGDQMFFCRLFGTPPPTPPPSGEGPKRSLFIQRRCSLQGRKETDNAST
jgi:hypothetical protein